MNELHLQLLLYKIKETAVGRAAAALPASWPSLLGQSDLVLVLRGGWQGMQSILPSLSALRPLLCAWDCTAFRVADDYLVFAIKPYRLLAFPAQDPASSLGRRH